MHKRGLLALILVIALLMTTSCSLIVKDEEVDKQTVIIEVGTTSITQTCACSQLPSMAHWAACISCASVVFFLRSARLILLPAESSFHREAP